jgi:hypothetical protein
VGSNPTLSANGAAPGTPVPRAAANVRNSYDPPVTEELQDPHGTDEPAEPKRPTLQMAHPVLADLAVRVPAGELPAARVAAARARPRKLERYWPVWVALSLAGVSYAAWAATNINPFGFMIGVHLVLGFGLLSWSPETLAGLRGVGRFALRRPR